MSVLDITNDLEVEAVFTAGIGINTTINTTFIDITNFDPGFMFIAAATTYTDGTFVLTLQDSPDNSVWTDVPVNKLNDPGGNGNITITSSTVAGELWNRLGAFSTDKFVRITIVSSGVTTGADITIAVAKKPENTPI